MIPFDFEKLKTGEYNCVDKNGNLVTVTATNDHARIYQRIIQIDNNGIEEYIIQDQLRLVKK